jgi:hypothetical protein
MEQRQKDRFAILFCLSGSLRRVDTMVPSWSGGFCEGPLLTQESGRFCWSGGFYEEILHIYMRLLLKQDLVFIQQWQDNKKSLKKLLCLS